MKGIKPTSYLNNMIIYINPPPAGGNGRLLGCLPSRGVGARPGLPSHGEQGGRVPPSPWGGPCRLPPQLPGPRVQAQC